MSDVKQNRDEPTLLKSISRLWWMPLLRGILLIILGIYALFKPGMTIAILVQVLSLFLIAEGIVSLAAAIMGNSPSRLWTGVRGVLAVVVGLIVFLNPISVAWITEAMLLYLIAGFLMIAGVLEIVSVIKDHKSLSQGAGWMLAGGGALIVLSLLIFAAPLSFGALIVRIIAVGAIINGISYIAMSFRLRSMAKLRA